ncbi:MAG: HAMP domain-containing sensor histidine kinase [Pseudomonadota bacterium]
MTQRSLRSRLLVAAVISISAALVIAGISLVVMFERHVERRIGSELDIYLNQITATVSVTNNERIAFIHNLADPRFNQPLSGLYWQIQDEERPTLLRSRSLWDNVIELPDDNLTPGAVHGHLLPGPAGQALIVRERQIFLQANNGERRIRIAVAVNEQTLVEARNAFAADMLPYLAMMASVLLLAAWIQVRIGLTPLDAVRRGVTEIRSGAKRRLERLYPDEVMPLVDEMNGLLEVQEQTIERARAWTADLAHGLKTPLMVLTADSQQLREEGHTSIADNLDQLAETMRRRVDRELIRARVRSGIERKRMHADAADAVNGVVRTLKRSPRGAVLRWLLDVPNGADAAILPEDLTELLGNILENATKWANNAVSVSVTKGNKTISIRVEDDGPGVPENQLNTLGQRGVRLDEQKQGTGLGLAIARDVSEAYHGKLSFHRSPMGGLAVTVQIPRSR